MRIRQIALSSPVAGCAFAVMWVFTLFLTFSVAQVTAEDPTQPALFQQHKRSIENTLRLPRSFPEGSHQLRCSSVISIRGFMGRVNCFPGNFPNEFLSLTVKRLVKSARNARLRPARINGIRTQVWFNFTVLITKQHGETQVKTVPNHRHDAELYGLNYSEPQRQHETVRWGAPGCGRFVSMVVALVVHADGTQGESSVVQSMEEESQQCQDGALRVLRSQKFIPGTHEGKFVPANYAEFFYSHSTVNR